MHKSLVFLLYPVEICDLHLFELHFSYIVNFGLEFLESHFFIVVLRITLLYLFWNAGIRKKLCEISREKYCAEEKCY